jgi:hypothetical protein
VLELRRLELEAGLCVPSAAMKRCIHELSDPEKRQAADELMLPTGVFGAMLAAGILCVVLLWQPSALVTLANVMVASAATAR